MRNKNFSRSKGRFHKQICQKKVTTITLSRQAGIPRQKQELFLFVILLELTDCSATLLTQNKNQPADIASPGIASLLKGCFKARIDFCLGFFFFFGIVIVRLV
jgi:hypothetical protein